MTEVAERVLAETKRFHRAVPDLLPKYRGRWVVFLNGAVESHHATEQTAFETAVKRYGVKGGFVIAQVMEVTAAPVTARVLYGMT